MTHLEQETLRTIAAEWRLSEQHDAVDDDGHIFKTEGGNDYDGAEIWTAVDSQHGS